MSCVVTWAERPAPHTELVEGGVRPQRAPGHAPRPRLEPQHLGREVHAVTQAVTVAELPRLPLLSSTLEVIGCIQSTYDKSTNVTRDLNACYLKRQYPYSLQQGTSLGQLSQSTSAARYGKARHDPTPVPAPSSWART